ncbi:MAG: arylamine N-acetyltransferase [Pseudomonadota bacterium]|nr:arylamine N-acetyltransferase [Pseudomonadota bacterium]
MADAATLPAERSCDTSALDLDAYFERIGWDGTTRVGLDTLSRLVPAHMRSIPFENLDVLLGRPVRLDLESLQAKLVRAHRGGYCFEHATLLAAVLERLGFRPSRHSARVTMASPRSASPRTHMFLTVPLDEGIFVVDAGFGSLAPPFPVPLLDGETTHADDATHWMARDEGFWWLRAKSGGETIDAWASTLEEDQPIDFELANHYIATHPASAFVNRILMRALIAGGRVTVMNRDVTVWRDGVAQDSQLADRAALRALVAEHFGFDLPQIERVRVPSIEEWA